VTILPFLLSPSTGKNRVEGKKGRRGKKEVGLFLCCFEKVASY